MLHHGCCLRAGLEGTSGADCARGRRKELWARAYLGCLLRSKDEGPAVGQFSWQLLPVSWHSPEAVSVGFTFRSAFAGSW